MAEKKISRQKRAQQKKEMIFNCAFELLKEKNYESITVRDIVRRAGISIGSFYDYYDSKLDVFYETYVLADQFFDETVRASLQQSTAYERILCFFDYYARYNDDLTDIRLTKLLFNVENKCFNRESDIGMHPLLVETIQWGMKRGEIKSTTESAEQIATYLQIATRGLVYHWCTVDGSYNLRDAMAAFVKKLLRIYF